MRFSSWLRQATGIREVERNGRPSANFLEVILSIKNRASENRWLWDTVYEPLSLLTRWPTRAAKYFIGAEITKELMVRSGGSEISSREVHSLVALTSYLDAIVDECGNLSWALALGTAVFGMRDWPGFTDDHDELFRSQVKHDYPVLRLLLEGKHRQLFIDCLMKAAEVEAFRNTIPRMEYKLISNAVCILPYQHLSGVSPELLEPIAMIYTFLDDSMDVSEDMEQGIAYMIDNESIETATAIGRAALSELNSVMQLDYHDLMELSASAAELLAKSQLRGPIDFPAVKFIYIFFVTTIIYRKLIGSCTQSLFRFVLELLTTYRTTR